MGSDDALHHGTRGQTLKFTSRRRLSHRAAAAAASLGDDDLEPQPVILQIHRSDPDADVQSEDESLAAHLASLVDLRLQLQQAAWNLSGIRAGELTHLFQALSDELTLLLTEVAHQTRMRGLSVRTSVSDLMELTLLRPFPDGPIAVHVALNRLADAYLTLHEDAWTAACRFPQLADGAASDVFLEALSAYERHLSRLRAAFEPSPSNSPSAD